MTFRFRRPRLTRPALRSFVFGELTALFLACALGAAGVTASGMSMAGCGGKTPKVVVDQADRAAYDAVRGFQTAEESAWHAKATWPTATQHQAINAKVSSAYQLIIDVANLGLGLPPGSQLSAADLAVVSQLTTVVADIVSLVQQQNAPPAVVTLAHAAQSKANTLADRTKGVRR